MRRGVGPACSPRVSRKTITICEGFNGELFERKVRTLAASAPEETSTRLPAKAFFDLRGRYATSSCLLKSFSPSTARDTQRNGSTSFYFAHVVYLPCLTILQRPSRTGLDQ
ncbi:uncharacterized protein VDAG_00426 [Verticillium dahliae VdLs.17]|uniref:Uncharacterized protein n=1 Tax=Verticillium dahliae (strain VdLs.17 / ATCC MYA-4575 / FGSC 10137) TaxID=498257 RepID=G2WS93_VERDV|nr:uncharacterized protein VDAG_00426 [Verticillium dahliae VdLs.17]EGY13744.1 hypothetical protein VDAG_00426 [Verticillium dahliae VdLs.17]